MSILSFPDRAGATIAQVYQDIRNRLLPQLERKVLQSQSIGTASTAIVHGLKGVPRIISPLAQTNVTIYRSAAPDDTWIYLAASTATTADVEVAL